MKNNNFLDFVYKINDDLTWTLTESGEVIVDMENKGLTNKIAQKLFKKPKISHITLEGMGSFIFTCIDGKTNVYEIGKLVEAKYGDEAKPLYERLSVFIKQLENLGYIKKQVD